MPELTEGYQAGILALAVPGLYCLLVLAGRRLKRHHGVHLGWLYHLFSLSLAVYLPTLLLKPDWARLRQMETEGVLAAEKRGSLAQAQQTEYAAGFLDRLRGFFEL